ncbi:MAG: hypothetical protein HY723_00510 [Chloroflexi bacterium]|nr:hypothetical protein [Chloroflexota bacterium]
MRRARFALDLAALAGAAVATALLHHGHVQAFVADVYDALRALLPARLRRHRSKLFPSLLQVYYGKPEVHYEVWVQRKPRAIEIGLHFEGERESNRRWADALAASAAQIQAALGPRAELEQWTRSWTRLHETRPIVGEDWRPKRDLTPELVREVAARLARYITVLEPIVEQERATPRRPRAPRSGAAGAAASRSTARRASARSRRP